jgi:uncharacterized protein
MGENDHTSWDDLKNERNIAIRAIDFAGLDAAFDGRFVLVLEDMRRDYGEQRFNMLVELHGVVLNITFTPRPPKYRIISVSSARSRERRLYDARQQSS